VVSAMVGTTARGRLRYSGWSCCSTEAKKLLRSMWRKPYRSGWAALDMRTQLLYSPVICLLCICSGPIARRSDLDRASWGSNSRNELGRALLQAATSSSEAMNQLLESEHRGVRGHIYKVAWKGLSIWRHTCAAFPRGSEWNGFEIVRSRVASDWVSG